MILLPVSPHICFTSHSFLTEPKGRKRKTTLKKKGKKDESCKRISFDWVETQTKGSDIRNYYEIRRLSLKDSIE